MLYRGLQAQGRSSRLFGPARYLKPTEARARGPGFPKQVLASSEWRHLFYLIYQVEIR